MPRYPMHVRRRAVEAVSAGNPPSEVAAVMGVPIGTVRRWLRHEAAQRAAEGDAGELADQATVPAPSTPVERPPAEPTPVAAVPAATSPVAESPEQPEEPEPEEHHHEPEAVTTELPVVVDADTVPTPVDPPEEGEVQEREPESGHEPVAPPAPVPEDDAPVPAPPARRRRRAIVAVAAAVVAVLVVGGLLLQGRGGGDDPAAAYADVADEVDAAYLQLRDDRCAHSVVLVEEIALFDRAATTSLTHLSIVAEADHTFPAGARADVGSARGRLADRLIANAPTPDQRAVQAQLGTATDIEGACRTSLAPETVDRVDDPTAADVDDLRAQLEAVTTAPPGGDTDNLDAVREAILAVAPVVAGGADARLTPAAGAATDVDESALLEAGTALAGAVAAMNAETSPTAVLDAASRLADYAFVGESYAGAEVSADGVPIVELPSETTPLVTPEPEIRDAVDEIPAGLAPPNAGAPDEPLLTPSPVVVWPWPTPAPTTPSGSGGDGPTRPSTPPASPSPTPADPEPPVEPEPTTVAPEPEPTPEPTTDPEPEPEPPPETEPPADPEPPGEDPPAPDEPGLVDPVVEIGDDGLCLLQLVCL